MPHQIIYHSRALHRGAHVTDLDILNEAILSNTAQDVSGFLLKSYDHFVQVLEGSQTVLDPLYKSIYRDPRHFEVTVRFSSNVETRQFSAWTMGYEYQSDLEIPRASQLPEGDVARWVSYIRQTFLTLSQKHQSDNKNPGSLRKSNH